MKQAARFKTTGLSKRILARIARAAASTAFMVAVATGAGAQPNFSNPVFYSSGPVPTAVAVGDLDGDRDNDIAVVSRQGHLRLLFNNGSGLFTPVEHRGLWPLNAYTLDVAIGDLDRDGDNDLAVAFTTSSGAISVLLNQGNGQFAPPANYNLCFSSSGVAIGDFDGDGDNDIADVNQCFTAGIILNDGRGRFALRGAFGDGYGSKSIAAADFNGDGFNDLAYVNNGLHNISVLLNNRDATFENFAWYDAGSLPEALAAGDFDRDGFIDIAVANSSSANVTILKNVGSGSFARGVNYGAGSQPSSITAADLDGDADLDLIVTNRGGASFSVLKNNGGVFASPLVFGAGQSPVDSAAANLNGDTLLDLVVVNQQSENVAVLFGATGSAPPPPPAPVEQITLSARARSSKKSRFVDLTWSGASSSSVDVYRNGVRITTTANDGSHTDSLTQKSGTFTYKVCSAGTSVCSNNAAVKL